MTIVIDTPTQARLLGFDSNLDRLRAFLTYTDLSVTYEIKRLKNNKWFIQSNGEEAFFERMEELKALQKPCLLDESHSDLTTNSGLADLIAKEFDHKVINNITYPKPKYIPFANEPKFKNRWYQDLAVEKLLAIKHGAVSIPTGGGKSACILELTKQLGLKTLIVSPSVSIATQLYENLKYHLGEKHIGFYGDGKKKSDKLITVGMGQSLTKVEEGTEAYKNFSKVEVLITDESHLISVDTFKKVALELCKDAPYRFSLSATQMRNDGGGLLLDSIIGPVVMDLPLKQLVDEGFLAKPNFIVIDSESKSNYASKDTLRMLSKHLYNNAYVHEQAARLATKLVKTMNHQVLIMVDHIEQIQYIIPHLRHEFKVAHGGVTKANKKFLPPEYHKSNPQELLNSFNKNEYPVLIATQCLGMGSDFTSVNSIINLQGGKSEIKFMQLIGRGTRKNPNKSEFFFVDFDIKNNFMMHAFTESRIELYKSMYDNVKRLANF